MKDAIALLLGDRYNVLIPILFDNLQKFPRIWAWFERIQAHPRHILITAKL